MVFHEGHSIDSECYICSVKINSEWFLANDMSVTQGALKRSWWQVDFTTPYIS